MPICYSGFAASSRLEKSAVMAAALQRFFRAGRSLSWLPQPPVDSDVDSFVIKIICERQQTESSEKHRDGQEKIKEAGSNSPAKPTGHAGNL